MFSMGKLTLMTDERLGRGAHKVEGGWGGGAAQTASGSEKPEEAKETK